MWGESAKLAAHAPVAQLDRAPGFEPGGRRFESVRARIPNVCSDRATKLLSPLLRQVHLFQEGFVSRVRAKAFQQRVHFDEREAAVVLYIGFIEPLKRLVLIIPPAR